MLFVLKYDHLYDHFFLPQGWYSLGSLAEDGFRMPLSVLIELGLSELYLADHVTLQSALYRRFVQTNVHNIQEHPFCIISAYCHQHVSDFLPKSCRDCEDSDSYFPCSLALFNIYLQMVQREYHVAVKVSCQLKNVKAFSVAEGQSPYV